MSLRSAFLGAAVSFSLLTGCGPADVSLDQEPEVLAQDEAALTNITLKPLALRVNGTSAGLTVIHNTAEYKAFFGQAPGPDLDFRKHWVVHYRGGVKPTTDAMASITAITAEGTGAARVLKVAVTELMPGPACGAPAVPSLDTMPQAAVRISRQGSAKATLQLTQTESAPCLDSVPRVTNCEGPALTVATALAKFVPGETVHFGGLARGEGLKRSCGLTGCTNWEQSSDAQGVAPYWYEGTTSELRYTGFSARSLFHTRLRLANSAPRLEVGQENSRGVWESTFESAIPAAGPITASIWQGGSSRYPTTVQWSKTLETPIRWTVDLRESCYRITALRSEFNVDTAGNWRRVDYLMETGSRL